MRRIQQHPILRIPSGELIEFSFEGRSLRAREGEVIASALLASGIRVFRHHERDGAPQGIYCANGQCSQCMVIADGLPVKACMTVVRPGMMVSTCRGLPALPPDDAVAQTASVSLVRTPCLIVGGGPAGLAAATELAKLGVRALLVDDKQRLGGKLTLQTHAFFGSRGDCYAGTRGVEIARLLEGQLRRCAQGLVEVWLESSVVAVFCDGRVGVVRQGGYVLVEPEVLLVAAGAREKALAFPGCDLPGVYGAGAFQTLVNRDLVRPAERLFICGGGNVGLIAGYHALQAGIEVAGLAEAMPACGGYKVHLDKLKRLGVPVYTSHTILRAEGSGQLESVTIGGLDGELRPLAGTEKSFAVDTLLIAVGLSPVNEMYLKAREYGMKAYAAGDAEQIAEASAAMLSGRIQGRRIAGELHRPSFIPAEWAGLADTLRGRPGPIRERRDHILPGRQYPVIRCSQQIPCNPCSEVCPRGAIRMREGLLAELPVFEGELCLGCAECVLRCPGLAIVLVDEGFDRERRRALLTLPFELGERELACGEEVDTVGVEGEPVGAGTVVALRDGAAQDRRLLLLVEVPFEDRLRVAGVRRRAERTSERAASPAVAAAGLPSAAPPDGDAIICRCERVRKEDIVALIRSGCRDMNQIKATLRAGMGACGGKTCTELILRLFREQGVEPGEVTLPVYRPPEMELPLAAFAGSRKG
jgi:sarcosine oxidase subunit alpha